MASTFASSTGSMFGGIAKGALSVGTSLVKLVTGAIGGVLKGFGSLVMSAGKFILVSGLIAGAFGLWKLGEHALGGILHGLETVISKSVEFRDAIRSGDIVVNPALANSLEDCVRVGDKLRMKLATKDMSIGIETTSRAVEQLERIFTTLLMLLVGAIAPGMKMIAEDSTLNFTMLTPIIETIGRAFTEVVAIAESLIEVLGPSILVVVQQMDAWLRSTNDVGDSWTTIGGVILGALRAIGKAGAYVWDTFKAGVGALNVALGFIIKKFGDLIDLFYRAIKALKNLPSRFQPAGLDGFINDIEVMRDTAHMAGQEIMDDGWKAINNFGQSATIVSEVIDRVQAKAVAKAAAAAGKMAADAKEVQMLFDYDKAKVGAVEKGSREMASVSAKFRTEGLLNPAVKLQQEQLREAQLLRAELERVRKQFEETIVIGRL